MTLLDQQQLVSIVHRYYPSDRSDNELTTSPERKAFLEVWDRAMREDHSRWSETVKAIRDALSDITVLDSTGPGYRAGFACVAYVKRQPLIAEARLDTMVIAYRSVLARVCGLAWAQRLVVPRRRITDRACPWQDASIEIPEELQPFAELMTKQIERDLGIQRLPVELARTRVPDIHVDFVPLGEATLFDALFDANPTTQP